MKRILFTFGAVVLLGAGCESSSVSVPTATEVPAEASSATVEVKLSEGSSMSPKSTASATVEIISESAPAALALSMKSGNFFFDPAIITASPGQDVSISFSANEGVHTFVIDELDVKKSISVGTVVTFTAPTTPGSYVYYCDVGAHQKLGMEGVLIVK